MAYTDLDPTTQQRVEAAVFRRLLAHLDERKDVQNIELMNLAGFCRNCLANWLKSAAEEEASLTIDKAAAREVVYGMPYATWKAEHQRDATPEELALLAQRHKH